MARIAYDESGMSVIVESLPEIIGEGWRKRKAEANRIIHIRRLHDELWRAKGIWDKRTATTASHIYKLALDIPEGDFWDRWLVFANACFAPVLDRADAQYWLDRDQYVDWWQMARLNQGAARNAERAGETWFAGALGAGD